MKNTLTLLAVAAACAVPAFAASPVMPATGTTVTAGSTLGGLTLNQDMTFGSLTADQAKSVAIPRGGDFWASDYTLSLWVDTASFAATGNTTLFAYYGSQTSSTNGGGYGVNALVWQADSSTLLMGDGRLDLGTKVFTNQRGDTSSALTATGKINITLSSTGKSGNNGQNVSVYINGELHDTLIYNGNMNGNVTTLNTWLNQDLTWGCIAWTDSALKANEIASFINPAAVPEPATATLSLLALAGLAARRRRK